MRVSKKRVEKITKIRESLEELRWDIAKKHDFAYNRPQFFKNCVVIRWPLRDYKLPHDYERIEAKVDVAHGLCDKYKLWEKDSILESSDLLLAKIGIYCFHEFNQTWAIADEYKKVQAHVLSVLPKWAKVSVKGAKYGVPKRKEKTTLQPKK